MVIPHVLLPIRSVVFVRLLFLVAVVDSVMFDCSIALGGRILRSLRFRSLFDAVYIKSLVFILWQ